MGGWDLGLRIGAPRFQASNLGFRGVRISGLGCLSGCRVGDLGFRVRA